MASFIDKEFLTLTQEIRKSARCDYAIKTVAKLRLLADRIRLKQLTASESAQLLDDEAEKMENEVRNG